MQCCVVQDGYLDGSEVAQWILPGEVDHADNEAKHLIHETDTDKVDPSLLKPSATDAIETEPCRVHTHPGRHYTP